MGLVHQSSTSMPGLANCTLWCRSIFRCWDVSSKCTSSVPNQEPLPNPFGDQILMEIQLQVAEVLIARTSYVKKLLEDCNNSEDTTKLLRYCCWENPHFSSTVLSELLWQIAYSYTYELRPYLDLLLQMLLLEDSWQNHRIHNALKGIPDDRDGLLDTIQRSKSHYQKRAYQCIKMMVALFMHCPPAQQMLLSQGDLKRRWTMAVDWLSEELERRPYPGNTQYTYNNWSPPAQSNETSNGYFLERSQSARVTLAKAIELCPDPDEDQEEELTDGDADTSHPEEALPVQEGAGDEQGGSKRPQNNQQAAGEKPAQMSQPSQPAQTSSQPAPSPLSAPAPGPSTDPAPGPSTSTDQEVSPPETSTSLPTLPVKLETPQEKQETKSSDESKEKEEKTKSPVPEQGNKGTKETKTPSKEKGGKPV